MKRHTFRRWLLLGALGASCLAGCTSDPQRTSLTSINGSTANPSRPAVAWAPAHGTNADSDTQAANQAQPRHVVNHPVVTISDPVPVTHEPPTAPPPAPVVPVTPVVHQQVVAVESEPPAPAPTPTVVAAPAIVTEGNTHGPVARVEFDPGRPAEDNSVVLPDLKASRPAGPQPTLPRAETISNRRSFVDLTASPCFDHAPDYNWIIGQVEYSRIAKEWRLRYAGVDEVDQHGGRLILIENHHVSLLRDGQFIHARGHLVNSADGNGAPHYRIESFKLVDNPNSPTASR